MKASPNRRAFHHLANVEQFAAEFRIAVHTRLSASRVFDFGVEVSGGINAGIELAQVCLGGLGSVQVQSSIPLCHGGSEFQLPLVHVTTDHPLVACMGYQFGGWQVKTEDYFAIGSGPMRACRNKEDVIERYGLGVSEDCAVGVLESGDLPTDSVIESVASECGVDADSVVLCVAPTKSQAGGLQVVARSIEACMHKLFELDADLATVVSGMGNAFLPPVSRDDLVAIGRTNDSILYGGRVTLWVDWTDDMIKRIGPQIPSNSSPDHGKPFAEIFKASGRDFYALDPMLFSVAHVTLVSTQSGNVFSFGEVRSDILEQSFFG